MTLSRLALAWAPVALWFVAVSWFTERRPAPAHLGRRLVRCGGEALVTTLLAALWFDSLGHGGWWLLFVLLGVLAGVPARLRELEAGAATARAAALLGMADAGRYVAAGALLAWRLG